MPARTLLDRFEAQVVRRADRVALRSRREGRWVGTTWAEWRARARAVAAGLVDAGVRPGDRVAILSQTREEWVVADLGAMQAGAVTVPIYPTLTAEQVGFVLRDSGARVVFAEDARQLDSVLAAERHVAGVRLERVVLFDLPPGGGPLPARAVPFAGFDAPARAAEVEARISRVAPADLATLVYTSGTSAEPKGVMLTHANLAFEVSSVGETLALSAADEQLLFLPLAHIFGRVLVAAQLEIGFTTSFAQSLARALDDMTEVNPTFFASVPRLFEKIWTVAEQKASAEGALKERLYRWAIDVGRRASQLERAGDRTGRRLAVQRHYADEIVLSKLRARFGSRLRFALSGAAPLAPELAEWFHACGVLVLEGYGLTETTAATHVNRPGDFRFGTVGPPLPGVQARIADDGEVLVRAPNVMRGYWNQPAATAEAIDEQGWLHTGDVGEIDGEGFLRITDRKKDIIVTAGGKNIAPQAIESRLEQSPFLAQAMVHGDLRKYLVALVALEPGAALRWAREHGRPEDLASLAQDPEMRALVQLEIDAVNRKLASFETIKRFAILGRELTVERGELTPTLKVKRRAVYDRYRDVIDGLYDEER